MSPQPHGRENLPLKHSGLLSRGAHLPWLKAGKHWRVILQFGVGKPSDLGVYCLRANLTFCLPLPSATVCFINRRPSHGLAGSGRALVCPASRFIVRVYCTSVHNLSFRLAVRYAVSWCRVSEMWIGVVVFELSWKLCI